MLISQETHQLARKLAIVVVHCQMASIMNVSLTKRGDSPPPLPNQSQCYFQTEGAHPFQFNPFSLVYREQQGPANRRKHKLTNLYQAYTEVLWSGINHALDTFPADCEASGSAWKKSQNTRVAHKFSISFKCKDSPILLYYVRYKDSSLVVVTSLIQGDDTR